MKNKLYIEFRVEFDSKTNQELLHALGKAAQESIFTMFNDDLIIDGEAENPPSPLDVTYEVIMEVKKDD